MEINDTVIENIRKHIKTYREEIADREKKINVLLDSIDFEESNLSAAATKKYAGRYFLEKDSNGNEARIFKLKRFERVSSGWIMRGDYFWLSLWQGIFNIEKNTQIYLRADEDESITKTIANLESEYTEISKEEFQKYKDLATKNIISDL